jgi:23S rRNA (uracil1939-C5)-methyltransferase
MLTPGATIDLAVEKPAAGGRMIGRHEGQVVLVSGAIPGERVRVRVERAERSVAYAEVTEVLEASADRRPVAGDPACGGNVYAHVAYPRQVAIKRDVVLDALRRIGKITIDAPVQVEPSPETGYRMRARLHARGGRLGFFREGTHDLCDAAQTGQLLPETCDALKAAAEEIAALGGAGPASIELAENLAADERALHLELRTEAGVVSAAFSVLARVPGVTGVTCLAPPSRDILVLGGRPAVRDPLSAIAGADAAPAGATLARRAAAFFQANRYLLPTLVSRVVSWIPDGPVVDLYAGVGLFAVSLAALGRSGVTAVEGDRVGGQDLSENAGPFGDRLHVDRTAVETFLRRRAAAPGETLLVDPPRTGMSREAMTGVIGCGAARIVYVSCDVATLARDVRRLLDAGYALAHVEAFDLFPNTAHVESLIVLERNWDRTPRSRKDRALADVEVKPSRIEGLGIFAARAFRAGERIRRVNVVREITPEAPLREDRGERFDHCSYPAGKVVLLGYPDRHINHRCDPNAWERFEEDGSYFVARRDIAAGEEITCDYNVNIAEGTAWPCNCGAARCRGEVAGDFFLLPREWQREYRPFLAEWFVRRHGERLADLDRREASSG